MRSDKNGPNEPLPPFGALPEDAPRPAERNRQILRWFRGVLPVLILVFAAGIALLGLQLSTWRADTAAQSGGWESSENTYSLQETVTRWGPAKWVAKYNRGTALLHLGELEEGRTVLEDAFMYVPKARPDSDGKLQVFTYECQVRINLAVSWEAVGDQLMSAAKPQDAVPEYDRALEWAEPCQLTGPAGDPDEGEGQPQPQPPEQSQESASAADRIEEKRDRAEREAAGEEPDPSNPEEDESDSGDADPADQPEEDPFAGETDAERERREELEKRNQDQAEREREKNESESRRTGSRGW